MEAQGLLVPVLWIRINPASHVFYCWFPTSINCASLLLMLEMRIVARISNSDIKLSVHQNDCLEDYRECARFLIHTHVAIKPTDNMIRNQTQSTRTY